MATFRGVTASQSITGVDFQPEQVLLTSAQDLARIAPVVQSRFGIGASDGVTEGSSAFGDQNAVATTNVDTIDKISKVFVKYDTVGSTIDAQADLTSLDVDGFTLNWASNDAVQTQILYLALATQDVTEVRLLSFNATRYNRGVLLQWRTGYEIDNLGFVVYREINGVRTRVNASLVAGSGLQAGQGTAVNAVQTYALWDLSADAPIRRRRVLAGRSRLQRHEHDARPDYAGQRRAERAGAEFGPVEQPERRGQVGKGSKSIPRARGVGSGPHASQLDHSASEPDRHAVDAGRAGGGQDWHPDAGLVSRPAGRPGRRRAGSARGSPPAAPVRRRRRAGDARHRRSGRPLRCGRCHRVLRDGSRHVLHGYAGVLARRRRPARPADRRDRERRRRREARARRASC